MLPQDNLATQNASGPYGQAVAHGMAISALHHAYAMVAGHGAACEAARATVAACYQRLKQVDDPGIMLWLVPQDVAEARALALPAFDPVMHPLWGIPFAVKDNIDLAGCPTSAACPAYAFQPAQSAFVVRQLETAGAIAIGKTNMDQFATGLVGVRTPHAVPRNVFDELRVPGGSSSGSAVAVAQGIVSFALGTDTAGSGRIPAAFNNIVGLKPSLGALSTSGVVPACRTLDCVSIFALTVADAARIFTCAAGDDEADAYSRPLTHLATPPHRVAVPEPGSLLFEGEHEAADAWALSVKQLCALDVTLVEIDMAPFFEVAKLLYQGPWVAERRAAVGAFMDAQPDTMNLVVRGILQQADGMTAVDTFRAFYRLAELKNQCAKALADVDALAVPTAPCFPTLAELKVDPVGPNSRLGTYTNFVNLLDLAALALPGPFRSDGLPAGLTLVGRRGSDMGLTALGQQFFAGTGGVLSPATG